MRLRAVAAIVAVFLPLCAAQFPRSRSFPVENVLRPPKGSTARIQRPVGAVAGLDTTIYVATVAGQLYMADIKQGNGTLLNTGGDDQPMGGLCLDSRGPGTLYAPGGESGALYAFNREGELLQRYQIANLKEAPVYLSGCIQTRYQLIIIDSLNNHFYYLTLADDGPLRGHPPPINEEYTFQGFQIPYEGDWVAGGTGFNAFGVEWTSRHNETAFVMNTDTGELFTFTVKKERLFGDMTKVNIEGAIQKFPGALQILFDSKNENVMYLSLPHMNSIAALEISYKDPTRAKFIRILSNNLLDGPLALSEYGEWIYAVNGRFAQPSGAVNYSLVQVPRHNQRIEKEDQEFTDIFDGIEITPPPIVTNPDEIEDDLREPPQVMGTHAPPPPGDNGGGGGGGGSNSTTPTPLATETPAATDTEFEPSDSPAPTPSPLDPEESPEPSPSESPTPSPSNGPPPVFTSDNDDFEEDDSSSACFPASALVETQERGIVRMDHLMIGDSVLVGRSANGRKLFSKVFLFTHQDERILSDFVSIVTEGGNTLDLSMGHYLYVNGKLITAKETRVGDILQGGDGMSTRVHEVRVIRDTGLYNPQTMHGDIIVNGIKTSTYTSAIEPAVATALLSPVRAAYNCGTGLSRFLTSFFASGVGSLERFL